MMLSIKNLKAGRGQGDIMGLDLRSVPARCAIMGPNGSGKSTLAHILAGRDGYDVTDGEILFEGRARSGWHLKNAPVAASSWRSVSVELPGINNMKRSTERAAQGVVSGAEVFSSNRSRETGDGVDVAGTAQAPGSMPAGRRKSATRYCRWRCSSPGSRSSTRLTRARYRRSKTVSDGVNALRSPDRSVCPVTLPAPCWTTSSRTSCVLAGGRIVRSGDRGWRKSWRPRAWLAVRPG